MTVALALGLLWALRDPGRHLALPPDSGPQRAAPAPARAPRTAPGPARVAVVVDDLGDNLATGRRVLALEPPVTVAILPFRGASTALAAEAVERGCEVILHLPLEPETGERMAGASGFLRAGMSVRDLERQLDADLLAVPYIVGVNGHMGSRFTRDPGAMRTLLTALRARGLFFLDSRTSPDSVAADLAARIGVPFAERAVFLDHDPAPAAVAQALARVERIARAGGAAIAIGHPHPATLAALARWLPAARRAGLTIVPASALTR